MDLYITNYKGHFLWKSFTKLTFVLLLAYVPRASAQQVIGRFYPERQQYLVGEPIIVVFEITNNSAKDVEIDECNCPWPEPSQFEVDHASLKREIELDGCREKTIAGSFIGFPRPIAAGTKYEKRFLLDGPFELDLPGRYHVRAKRKQTIGSKTDIGEPSINLDVDSEFDVTLRAPGKGELEAAYQPLFDGMRSENDKVRYFAAFAVAQNPPPFAEAAILALGTADYTIRGLQHLATPAARARLLQMSSPFPPESVRQSAIEALGKIGNPEDCRAMLDIASESEKYTQAEAYFAAGRICKEKAVPVLQGVGSTGASQLLTGVAGGLGNTSSHGAVPPLIGLLQSQDQNVRRAAADSLATLTHRTSKYGIADEDSAKQSYGEWSTWWSANGNTAPIYSSDQCTAPRPLP